MKCTQYSFHVELAFKNARAIPFLKLGMVGNNFQLGLEKFEYDGSWLDKGGPMQVGMIFSPNHPIAIT